MKAQALSKKGSSTSLHHLMFVLQQLSNELLESEVKVGLSQVRIMSVLSHSMSYSQHGVAIRLRQTESNVSRQLRVMKRQGLVNIRQNPKDKRQREVVLTDKGKKAYDSAQHLLNAQQKDLLKLLSRSQAQAFNEAVDNLLKAIA